MVPLLQSILCSEDRRARGKQGQILVFLEARPFTTQVQTSWPGQTVVDNTVLSLSFLEEVAGLLDSESMSILRACRF